MNPRALTTSQHPYSRVTINKLVCWDIQGMEQKWAKPLLLYTLLKGKLLLAMHCNIK